ncbi:MAG TPA: FAD-dependent oxidoreductase [Geobacteraceae bacterium]|nr:FAD-dependent oxidoreductase [Geobacteraceae bacterium]
MPFRIVVIGANAAGAKAASSAKRSNPEAKVLLIDRSSIIAFSACGIPYYVSDTIAALKELVNTPDGVVRDTAFFHSVKGVEAVTGAEAIGIDRVAKKVSLFDRSGARPFTLAYDRLILATGSLSDSASMFSMGCPNILAMKTIEDAVAIKDKAIPGRAACIVGGGLAGLEIAEALLLKGMRVTLLEKHDHLLFGVLDRDMAQLLEKYLEGMGIKVLTSCRVAGFDGTTRVEKAMTNLGEVPADLVVLAPGVVPNITLAEEAGLKIGETGAIAVNEHMQTSDPHIFACGDCTEATHLVTGRKVYIPRGSTANKQARIAGINAAGGTAVFPGIVGTTIIRVFDFNAGKTGLSVAEAGAHGLKVETVVVPGHDRAHFFPGASPIILKMVAERETGRILGLQAVGCGALDKRIDAAAVAITFAATAHQLSQMDFAYAPPFAPAMDSLIVAADILNNKMAGHARGIPPETVRKKLAIGETFTLVDVRSPAEQLEGVIGGSIMLSLATLRDSVDRLPKGKEIVVICRSGLRAYEAQRILTAAGFADVSFMEGGLMAWPYTLDQHPSTSSAI